jgi:hypothetical protein
VWPTQLPLQHMLEEPEHPPPLGVHGTQRPETVLHTSPEQQSAVVLHESIVCPQAPSPPSEPSIASDRPPSPASPPLLLPPPLPLLPPISSWSDGAMSEQCTTPAARRTAAIVRGSP